MDQAKCTKCGQIKGLELFPANAKKRNGRDSWCRACHSARGCAYAKTAAGRASRRAYLSKPEVKKRLAGVRRRYEKRRVGEMSAQELLVHRARAYERMKEWRARPGNREKMRAWDSLRYAIKTGRMPRVETLACHMCSEGANHYHHYDGYTAFRAFKVVPLCTECHGRVHRERIAVGAYGEIKSLYRREGY